MESFGYEVADTARAMRRDFDRRAAALGVTRSQWRVLARLGRGDGARQVELADALDVEPITLARLVDRLADAGLVERRADERDRRAWNVFLTEKARPVIARLQALGAEFHADALAGIDEAQKEAARRVLTQIRDNLSDVRNGARRAS
jgi:MarR family transcriptional regulator for hemolysin